MGVNERHAQTSDLGKAHLANAEGHSTLSYLKRVLALEVFDIDTASFFGEVD
jgi:hypothetical protein